MRRTEADEAECIEACIEALDDAVIALTQHPPRALAEALAVHLQCLLETLQAQGHCSTEEVRQRLDELAQEVLGARSESDLSA